MSDSKEIEFVAYLPDIAGWWKPIQGGASRLVLEIPETEITGVLPVLTMRGKVLKVRISTDADGE